MYNNKYNYFFLLLIILFSIFLYNIFGTSYVCELDSRLVSPSSRHWFGTDSQGVDIFSRFCIEITQIVLMGVLSFVLSLFISSIFIFINIKTKESLEYIFRFLNIIPVFLYMFALFSIIKINFSLLIILAALMYSLKNFVFLNRNFKEMILDEKIDKLEKKGISKSVIFKDYFSKKMFKMIAVHGLNYINLYILMISGIMLLKLQIYGNMMNLTDYLAKGFLNIDNNWWICIMPSVGICVIYNVIDRLKKYFQDEFLNSN